MAYASERGQAFIDRELYLPEEWAKDKRRRERVGVPEEIEMRTKPDELAREMLGRASLDGDAEAAWVVTDSVYGDDARRLGMFLEEREQPYASWPIPRAKPTTCGPTSASTASARCSMPCGRETRHYSKK